MGCGCACMVAWGVEVQRVGVLIVGDVAGEGEESLDVVSDSGSAK